MMDSRLTWLFTTWAALSPSWSWALGPTARSDESTGTTWQGSCPRQACGSPCRGMASRSSRGWKGREPPKPTGPPWTSSRERCRRPEASHRPTAVRQLGRAGSAGQASGSTCTAEPGAGGRRPVRRGLPGTAQRPATRTGQANGRDEKTGVPVALPPGPDDAVERCRQRPEGATRVPAGTQGQMGNHPRQFQEKSQWRKCVRRQSFREPLVSQSMLTTSPPWIMSWTTPLAPKMKHLNQVGAGGEKWQRDALEAVVE